MCSDSPSAAMWLPLRPKICSDSGRNSSSSKRACALYCSTRRRTASPSTSAGWPLASFFSCGSSRFHCASMSRCSRVSRAIMACTRSRSSPGRASASTAVNNSCSSSSWCSKAAARKNLTMSSATARARCAGASSAGSSPNVSRCRRMPAWQCEKLFSGTSVSTGFWGAWLIVGSGLGGVAVPQRTAGVASVVHGPHARAPVS